MARSTSLLPKHLGGTKSHWASLMTPEELEASRQRHEQNQAAISELRRSRSAARDQRKFAQQASDEAYQRQKELEAMKFGYESNLQQQRLGQDTWKTVYGTGAQAQRDSRLAGYEAGLTDRRHGQNLIERAQAGDIAAQAQLMGYGYESQLGDQRYGQQRGLAELESDLLGRRNDQTFNQQLTRDDIQHGYGEQTGNREFAQTLYRDKTIAGEQANRDYRQFFYQTERDKTQQGYALESMATEFDKRMTQLGVVHQWQRQAAWENPMIEGMIEDARRIEERIETNELELPRNVATRIQNIDAALGEIFTNDRIPEERRLNQAINLYTSRLTMLKGAKEVPPERRQKTTAQRAQGGATFYNPATGQFGDQFVPGSVLMNVTQDEMGNTTHSRVEVSDPRMQAEKPEKYNPPMHQQEFMAKQEDDALLETAKSTWLKAHQFETDTGGIFWVTDEGKEIKTPAEVMTYLSTKYKRPAQFYPTAPQWNQGKPPVQGQQQDQSQWWKQGNAPKIVESFANDMGITQPKSQGRATPPNLGNSQVGKPTPAKAPLPSPTQEQIAAAKPKPKGGTGLKHGDVVRTVNPDGQVELLQYDARAGNYIKLGVVDEDPRGAFGPKEGQPAFQPYIGPGFMVN